MMFSDIAFVIEDYAALEKALRSSVLAIYRLYLHWITRVFKLGRDCVVHGISFSDD